MSLQKFLNKYNFGKFVLIESFFNIEVKKNLEEIYEKAHSNKLNYFAITNFFILSYILSVFIFSYIYNVLFKQIFDYSFKFLFIDFLFFFFIYFITFLTIYLLMLLFYYSYKDYLFRKIQIEIEENLPFFLDNLTSNLKGGISLKESFIKSVPKESKLFLKEIIKLNSKMIYGENEYDAINSFRKKFNSVMLDRTFFLILQGIKSGSNISDSLLTISKNLRKVYEIDNEIKITTSGFEIIIKLIVFLISPLLFALSLTLLTFISSLFDLISKKEALLSIQVVLGNEVFFYFTIFSICVIILTTFFSSLIISHFKSKKFYDSIKWLPFQLIFSIGIYIILRNSLLSSFSNLI